MDFSGLDAFLKARTRGQGPPKTRAAPPKRRERGARTKAPYTSLPEVLKEVLEEQSRQYRAYKEAKDWEIAKYKDEYPAFKKFYDIIKREEKTACLINPGQLDLDLADAIVRLKLHRLPSRVRRVAMSLCATLERKVTQRETGHPFNDPLPWPLSRNTAKRLGSAVSPTSSGTLTECRLALSLT